MRDARRRLSRHAVDCALETAQQVLPPLDLQENSPFKWGSIIQHALAEYCLLPDDLQSYAAVSPRVKALDAA